MRKVLVTGGAGYIGSFIVRNLKNRGWEAVIIDDLSSGHEEAVEGFKFHKLNLAEEGERLAELLREEKPDGVIHMAGFIQMGESFENPLKYYRNNLVSTINLVEAMVKNSLNHLVFSSSAGVYGNPERVPIEEDDAKNPTNPYGETKLAIEKMLGWVDKARGVRSMSIRYFNAAGASLDGDLGEDHPEESHLIPNIIKAALKGEKITIFGDDYDTPDGTNVRDYIHVLDLAETHTLALEALLKGEKTNCYNAGWGKGYSNKEVVAMVKEVGGFDFQVEFGPRRPGDASFLYASTAKIQKELGWRAKYGLKEIIETALKWHKSHPEGYSQ